MKHLFNILTFIVLFGLGNASAQTPQLVKDIRPGAVGGFEYTFYNGYSAANFSIVWEHNGFIYFVAIDNSSVPNGSDPGTNNYELWRSNGTTAGTSILKDINPGPIGSNPQNFKEINGELYFIANDGSHGIELWKTDGSTSGTVMVKDIHPGAKDGFTQTNYLSYNTIPFLVVWQQGSTFYFIANDSASTASQAVGTNNVELWKSDGTAAGTVLVKDINPGQINSSSPSGFNIVNGTLYFKANDGVNGAELWKTDGSTAGTVLVKDINPGVNSGFEYASSNSYNNIAFNVVWQQGNTFYFVANNYSTVAGADTNNIELWKSDGTTSGTVMLKDINPGNAFSSSPNYFNVVNNTLYFSARDAANGIELWKTDGSTVGTVLVKDINPGAKSGFEYANNFGFVSLPFIPVWQQGSTFYFIANDNTSAGGTSTHNIELWKSDGTAAGTVMVKDIYTGAANGSFPSYFNVINNTLFFEAKDATNGTELWKSDGTASGTVLVKDINPGTKSGFEYADNFGFTALPFVPVWQQGSTFYFVANDNTAGGGTSTHNIELWKSDGTTGGTVMVKDINPGVAASSSPDNFNIFNGVLYFRAKTAANGIELWKTDGSSGGTTLVKDINPGAVGGLTTVRYNYYNNIYFSIVGQQGSSFYFVANNYASVPNSNIVGTNNVELWMTDGTTAGTTQVADICSGNTGSDPANFAVALGKLFFKANDCTTGSELWVLNGVSAGVEDITADFTMHIYPNPTSTNLTVELNNARLLNSKLTIFDIQGKQILNTEAQDLKTTFDVSLLQQGVYIIKCDKEGEKSYVKRFVKM